MTSIYYMLSERESNKIYQSLDFVLAISGRERFALNLLLSFGIYSNLFGSSLAELSRKLQKVGIVSINSSFIRE